MLLNHLVNPILKPMRLKFVRAGRQSLLLFGGVCLHHLFDNIDDAIQTGIIPLKFLQQVLFNFVKIVVGELVADIGQSGGN